jgi:hypothetical protein
MARKRLAHRNPNCGFGSLTVADARLLREGADAPLARLAMIMDLNIFAWGFESFVSRSINA